MRLRTLAGLISVMVLSTACEARGQSTLVAGGGFADAAMAACRTDVRILNQVSGWAARWPRELEAAPVGTAAERSAAWHRWGGLPEALETDVRTLRTGLEAGSSAPRPVVRRVLAQVDGLLAESPETSPLWSPARRSPDADFADRWVRLAEEALLPAVRAYAEYLREDYLPRTADRVPLGDTGTGASCFTHLIESWTSLPLTPLQVDSIGRLTLASLREELVALAAPDYGATAAEILDRLRDGPLPEPFEGREDVVRHAEAAVARARAALPGWIRVEDLPVAVVPMPRSMEGSFPAGFYRPPAGAGPAEYVINTSRPHERRLLSEAIAFHETVPGHHTHFTARSGGGAFVSGFAEGWAIYAEGLAAEMGLYSTPIDRIGQVAKQLWATSRLVVEPGLHTRGWTRDRAIRFMLENTALPRQEIELEVDRYLALPGQSLGYMLGALHLRRIRDGAETHLAANFDIRDFHDVVLRGGMRPLPEVERDVRAWVENRG